MTVSLQFLLDIARQKNQTPLPLIKPYSGPRLPPDRYCLTAPNYRLKSLQKKVRSVRGEGFTVSGTLLELELSASLRDRCGQTPTCARQKCVSHEGSGL